MSYNIPYSFIPGTKARAQEVNANFKYVLDTADDLNRIKLNTTFSNISTEAVDFIKNCSSSRNIGEIITSPLPLTDDGIHLLDGALLPYGVYKEFIDYIADLYDQDTTANCFCTESQWQASVTQYGVCGKFVYDSVNNTVRLPKYSNKIYTSSIKSSTPVYSATPDGVDETYLRLGNCIGAQEGFKLMAWTQAGDGSTVLNTINTSGQIAGYDRTSIPTVKLIAPLSNITTSLDGYYYIVVATTSKTEIQSDIDEIATDLNGKADVDLTNVNNTGTSKVANWTMPSGTYDTLTAGASNTTYTAPANGYFAAFNHAGQNHGYIILANSSNGLMTSGKVLDTSTNWALMCYIPVKKGDIVRLEYNFTWNTASGYYFRFYYAQGSESEA